MISSMFAQINTLHNHVKWFENIVRKNVKNPFIQKQL